MTEFINGERNSDDNILIDLVKDNRKSKRRIIKFIIIFGIIILFLLSRILYYVDYNNVINDIKPKYMILINNNYYGLFNKLSLFNYKVYYGNWFYTYPIRNIYDSELYVINKDKRVLSNKGYRNVKTCFLDLCSYTIIDTFGNEFKNFDNVLDVKNGDVLVLDKDYNIIRVYDFYNNIDLKNNGSSFIINGLSKGEHVLSIKVSDDKYIGHYVILN